MKASQFKIHFSKTAVLKKLVQSKKNLFILDLSKRQL